MNNPIKNLTKKEWGLWLGSLLVVICSNILTTDIDLITMIAACIGITSLIFAAKGNVWAQILMVVFSILYGIISWRFQYWGEMITYLGMTMPMAIWSTITWIRHPAENGKEVAIQKLTVKHIAGLAVCGTITTAIFYNYRPTPALHRGSGASSRRNRSAHTLRAAGLPGRLCG